MNNPFAANKFVGINTAGKPVRMSEVTSVEDLAVFAILANDEDRAVEDFYLARDGE